MLIKIENIDAIPEGGSVIVRTPCGKEIALFKIHGKIHAIDNTCPHMGGPLGEGGLNGHIVSCPWHHWAFDVQTGQCLNMPGQDVETYPVSQEGSLSFLETDPAL